MRPRPGTVGAVLALLVVVGCSGETGEASPSTSPTPSETSTPTTTEPASSPSTQPPAVPHEATGKGRQGAIAFGLFFIDAINHTIASGQTNWFDDLHSASCDACKGIVKEARQIHDAGGSVKGGALTPDTYSAVRSGPRTWSVGIQADAGRQRIKPSPDEPERVRTGGSYDITLDLRRRAESWVIARMVVSES